MKDNDRSTATAAPESNTELDARVRKIVASLSRGNISLQAGAYETEADVEKLRVAVRNHKF